jgi:hypothetical protein
MLQVTFKGENKVSVMVEDAQAQELMQNCLLKKVAKTAKVVKVPEKTSKVEDNQAQDLRQSCLLKKVVKAPEKESEVADLKMPIASVCVKTIAYNTAVVVCKVVINNKRTIFVHNQLFNNSSAFSLMRKIKEVKEINLRHWHK